jgi:1,4-alpha-glucan branching enzyme
MPGDYQQKFANLRALYAYMLTHPGKKLLFMGGEFAQWIEWNCNASLDWNLLNFPQHNAVRNLTRDLNTLYKENDALWSDDFSDSGFQWLDGSDALQSVISYIRWDKEHKDPVVVILNLTPVVRDHYTTGIPLPGEWVEILNTDAAQYGGTNLLNEGVYPSTPGICHGQKQHITLRLPWLGAVILKKQKQ